MEKQDKTMVRTWNLSVGRIAGHLMEASKEIKDRELSRWILDQGEQLKYVVDDVDDTLSRL